MNYIKRAIEDTFLRVSNEFPALLLIGSRQVGKTTMLKKLLQDEGIGRDYVTLDDLTERQMAKNDPELFLQLHKPPVFIDEVQYAPELFTYIKILIDQNHNNGDFWLTSSHVFNLTEYNQEALSENVFQLNMSPMSQAEINGLQTTPFTLDFDQLVQRIGKRTLNDTPSLYKQIFEGGIPTLVSGQCSDHQEAYSTYLDTCLNTTVKELLGNIDSFLFMDFLTATASLCGQMLNYKTLAFAVGIEHTTIRRWIEVLEKLGIIFYLYPYSDPKLRRMVTRPKMYFYDCGLVTYLAKWNDSENLINESISESILENFVVSEMVKSYQNCGCTPPLYYYLDKDYKEINIILEHNNYIHPMLIKNTTVPQKQFSSIFSILDKATIERSTGAILCTTDTLSELDSKNLVVPIWGI